METRSNPPLLNPLCALNPTNDLLNKANDNLATLRALINQKLPSTRAMTIQARHFRQALIALHNTLTKPIINQWFYPTNHLCKEAQWQHLQYVAQVAEATSKFLNEVTALAQSSADDISNDIIMLRPANQALDAICAQYQTACTISHATENILQAVYIISCAALGFLIGAMIGVVIGALASILLGPGGLFIASFIGPISAFKCAIYGLVIGASMTSGLFTGVASHRFFQSTPLDNKMTEVQRTARYYCNASTSLPPLPKKPLNATTFHDRAARYTRGK